MLSKLICCAIVCFLLITTLFVIGTIVSFVIEGKTDSTTYFNEQNFNLVQALFYNFRVYFIAYLTMLIVMSIFSLVAVLVPHVAITFVVGCGVCMGLVYVSFSKFEFFISSVKVAFDVLDGKNSSFIVIALCMIVGLEILATIIFRKKDYLN